jgi:hypothetical protein
VASTTSSTPSWSPARWWAGEPGTERLPAPQAAGPQRPPLQGHAHAQRACSPGHEAHVGQPPRAAPERPNAPPPPLPQVGVLVSVQKYGSESSEILAAVRAMAGPATGLSIVDKASRAVNTIKVLQALESIVVLLKVGRGLPLHVPPRARCCCGAPAVLYSLRALAWACVPGCAPGVDPPPAPAAPSNCLSAPPPPPAHPAQPRPPAGAVGRAPRAGHAAQPGHLPHAAEGQGGVRVRPRQVRADRAGGCGHGAGERSPPSPPACCPAGGSWRRRACCKGGICGPGGVELVPLLSVDVGPARGSQAALRPSCRGRGVGGEARRGGAASAGAAPDERPRCRCSASTTPTTTGGWRIRSWAGSGGRGARRRAPARLLPLCPSLAAGWLGLLLLLLLLLLGLLSCRWWAGWWRGLGSGLAATPHRPPCSDSLGQRLDEDEVKEALKILDANRSGELARPRLGSSLPAGSLPACLHVVHRGQQQQALRCPGRGGRRAPLARAPAAGVGGRLLPGCPVCSAAPPAASSRTSPPPSRTQAMWSLSSSLSGGRLPLRPPHPAPWGRSGPPPAIRPGPCRQPAPLRQLALAAAPAPLHCRWTGLCAMKARA